MPNQQSSAEQPGGRGEATNVAGGWQSVEQPGEGRVPSSEEALISQEDFGFSLNMGLSVWLLGINKQ